MSGIMRAPAPGITFDIPYSGTHAMGDCIIIANENEAGYVRVSVVAYYDLSGWSHENNITYFSDKNNVISFKMNYIGGNNSAAFIPGPSHV